MPPTDRIERLKQELAGQEVDAYIATGAADAAYISGYYAMGAEGDRPVVVVPAEGDPTLLVSTLSKETAVREATIPVRTPEDGFADTVTDLIDGRALLSGSVSAQLYTTLSQEIDVTLDTDLLPRMRAVKEDDELDRIREAYRVTEEAIAMVDAKISAGKEERRIAAELEYAMRVRGSMGTGFPTIVASDAFTAVPHHATTGTAIGAGPVLFDVGAVFDGYRSDMTRTFYLGQPPEEFITVYETVREAQQAASDVLRAGVPAKEVDAAARQVIADAGYGDRFPHSTGHGVGLDVHEHPNLTRSNDDPVPEGAVVTVEPGIYLDGSFGVRIEDAYHVTEDGAERLTTMDRDLDTAVLDRS